jgi:predicted ATP-grasp superfamily ATP-dependent carboligase
MYSGRETDMPLDHTTFPETSQAVNRRDFPAIMVMEASAIGMIGVIRSLGRSGYPVHACSSNANALGLSSNFAAARAVHPDYDDPAFLNWLRNYTREHQIAVIVPSEGFLHAIRPAFDEFAPLVPVSDDPSVVYGAMSKSETFDALLGAPRESGVGLNNPPSLFVDENAPLKGPERLRALGLPLFIKVDSGHGRRGQDNQVAKADTAEEAYDAVKRLLGDYTKVLVQGFVPGTKVAADFCIHNGEVIVESMWEASHENPHRGGMASLRRVCWRQEIHDDALKKLRHLNWEGLAMMEYRLDPETEKVYFIELNAAIGADFARNSMPASISSMCRSVEF